MCRVNKWVHASFCVMAANLKQNLFSKEHRHTGQVEIEGELYPEGDWSADNIGEHIVLRECLNSNPIKIHIVTKAKETRATP